MSGKDLVLDGELADLETVVTQEPDVTETQPTTTDWIAENLETLEKETLPVLIMWGYQINSQAQTSGSKLVGAYNREIVKAKAVYPQLLHLERVQDTNTNHAVAKANILAPELDLLKRSLARAYGPDLEDTDVYEQIAPSPTIDQIFIYFPELEVLRGIRDLYADITSSPYEALFTISDLETRAFFTGTIKDRPVKPINFRSNFNYEPFTMKNALPYAKKIGALNKLHYYMEQLNLGRQ